MTTDSRAPARPGPPREWTPRMWQGCDLFAWLRLLVRNRFAVHLGHLYIAVVLTLVGFFNLALRWLQDSLLGDRPGRTPLRHGVTTRNDEKARHQQSREKFVHSFERG